ncbi:MAG: hypothetical protein DRQ51_04330 [Gammaproteobacteria bacterium]|nr:MAG: hypothetical protein DRQ51_04330 [Gammaproteobacteria bacterium]
MKLKQKITFFYTDGIEKQTTQPIADEALKRGYSVKFTDNILEKAEIGIYCQHNCFPENSKFSVIMFHDLGQGHNRWPDIWHAEPWHKFNIGILSGKEWVKRWQNCSSYFYARPKIGVFELGWPKADDLFQKDFKKNTDDLKNSLNLLHPVTILYAPSWENDNKQDEFVQSLKNLPVNLLLKQAPWSKHYPEILKNIETMDKLHRNYKDNVFVADRNVSIMQYLKVADILVSDESSVLIEGLLLDIPAVAVTDWRIPDCSPPRLPSIPFDFVIKTAKKELNKTILNILSDIDKFKKQLETKKNNHFSLLGNSANSIMDLIDNCVAGDFKNIKSIPPNKEKYNLSIKWFFKRWLFEKKLKLKIILKRYLKKV